MSVAPEDIANNMLVDCPGCAARYDVPDEAARPGRAMRCARCGEIWVPRPTSPESPSAAAVDVAPHPDDGITTSLAERRDAPDAERHDTSAAAVARAPLVTRPPPPGTALLAASWIASGVVLAIAGWAIWHAHVRIGHAWPASARLFRLF